MLSGQTLSSLLCFKSAARHLSFTLAAHELHLTQGAVSQRIRKLEEQLGFALFLRFNRRLQLTAEGQQLLQEVESSLNRLDNTVRDIRAANLSGELVISTPPSFALSWLSRHLCTFQKSYPQVRLIIETHNRLIDFAAEKVDLAIYYGQGEHPGLQSWKLGDEYLLPVCSPDYARESGLEQQIAQLSQCTLLHDAYAWPQAGPYAEWRFWAESQAQSLDYQYSYCFDMSEMAIQAALSGTGVALGRERLIQTHLQQGSLLNPLGPEGRIKSPQSYYLVSHEARAEQPVIRAFRQWLTALMR